MTAIIFQKLLDYAPMDAVDQENAIAEILQHYVLASLARSGFFEIAEFHGGTFLRIVHGADRFSEDLDFVLKHPDADFSWDALLPRIQKECAYEGLAIEVAARPERQTAVRKAILKTTLEDGLSAELKFPRDPRRKVRIKLEVDTHPPSGSTCEVAYLSFPQLTMVTVQTLPSAFASKSHALLCRDYTKGRDWYDFLFYVSRGARPNLALLENALHQRGPWAAVPLAVDGKWLVETLHQVVGDTDWKEAARDVQRFLSLKERETLKLWNKTLFTYQVSQLDRYLNG